MNEKIRVYGKAQNRTALGIVNAYLVINPKATLADLKAAFPDSLNPDSGVKRNFVSEQELKAREGGAWNGFFSKDEELLQLNDGTKAALVSMWTKPSFDRLVEKAKEYGIVIASFDAAEKGFGKKGGYSLEYLNGFQPAQPSQPAKTVQVEKPKKKSKKWIWIVIVIILILILLALLKFCQPAPQPAPVAEPEPVEQAPVEEKVTEIERKFNDVNFEKGKANRSDSAKAVLDELASYLNENDSLKLQIVGHTSIEGSDQLNQKLSEDRAKAAVDYLVEKGVDSTRLEAEGKGSSEPKDPNNQEANRRTEFKIIK